MIYWLCGICVICITIIGILLLKLKGIHKACDELRTEFAARLLEDTNVGIDISCADRKMRKLAADLDMQMKLLRKEHIRYFNGNRELQDAITNISHDLRTPLTAICGYLELLQGENKTEAAESYLKIIENRIALLKELTEELFRYSILVSVKEYESREGLCLNQIIEECMAGYYGVLTERGIFPEVSIPDQKIICRTNKAALVRILNNILSNAVKYSEGDLRVVLHKDGEICFSNHAGELDEVKVGKLFDRFYTVETGQKSTGLGLSIAKLLTEQLGGTISARWSEEILSVKINLL